MTQAHVGAATYFGMTQVKYFCVFDWHDDLDFTHVLAEAYDPAATHNAYKRTPHVNVTSYVYTQDGS